MRPKSVLIPIAFALLTSAYAQLPPDVPAFVRIAKANVVRDFKDPASAQFRGLFISLSADNYPALCGEVNAKNSFGAYVGFRPFFATREPGLQKIASDEDGVAIYQAMNMCGNKVRDIP